MLLTPYEIVSKFVIPSLRAMVAKRLILLHGFSQKEAAQLLGVSQSAISRYLEGSRGGMIRFESTREVCQMVDELKNILVHKGDKCAFIALFTELCDHIRREKLLCEFCRKIQPDIAVQSCHGCDRGLTRIEPRPLEAWIESYEAHR